MADNTQLLETYRANRKVTDAEFFKMVNSSLLFNLYMLNKLPMGFIAGLKCRPMSDHCSLQVYEPKPL